MLKSGQNNLSRDRQSRDGQGAVPPASCIRPKTRRNRRQRKGAILMEALLAGAILGIGLLTLVSITSRSLSRQQIGEHQIVAASLVDELLSMVLVEGPINYPKRNDLRGRFDPPFEDYEFQIEIDDQGQFEPFLVTATVRWTTNGRAHDAIVQTYIAERRATGDELREPGEPIVR